MRDKKKPLIVVSPLESFRFRKERDDYKIRNLSIICTRTSYTLPNFLTDEIWLFT